jgi:hypothetical protein
MGGRAALVAVLSFLCPRQGERRWVRRGPHAVWPGSVGDPRTAMGACAEALMVLRDRRSCLCSLRGTFPWWRSSGGCSGLQRVALRRGTSLVTTAQGSAAYLVLLSHVVEDGGVLCRVRLFCLGVLCGGVRFGSLCNFATSS